MCTGECTLRASLDLAEGDVVDEDVLVVVRTGSLDGPGGWIAVTSIGELCEAARNGHRKVVEALVVAGAPIDAADYDRRTCLHLAASEGNVAIVEYLIQAKANLDAEDRWGSTPLRDAVREGHRKVAAMMHQAGAKLGSGGEFTLSKMEQDLKEMVAMARV